MVITFGVDAARSSIGTLYGTVKRRDEVAADPAAALWCGMSVQLHEVRVTESSRRAIVRAEDQLHCTIVARMSTKVGSAVEPSTGSGASDPTHGQYGTISPWRRRAMANWRPH